MAGSNQPNGNSGNYDSGNGDSRNVGHGNGNSGTGGSTAHREDKHWTCPGERGKHLASGGSGTMNGSGVGNGSNLADGSRVGAFTNLQASQTAQATASGLPSPGGAGAGTGGSSAGPGSAARLRQAAASGACVAQRKNGEARHQADHAAGEAASPLAAQRTSATGLAVTASTDNRRSLDNISKQQPRECLKLLPVQCRMLLQGTLASSSSFVCDRRSCCPCLPQVVTWQRPRVSAPMGPLPQHSSARRRMQHTLPRGVMALGQTHPLRRCVDAC